PQRLFARKGPEFLRIESAVLRERFEGDLEDLQIQPVLSLEMVVYGGLIYPSLRNDVTHARALETLIPEQINRSLYDRAAGIFGWTGHLSLGSNGRLNSLHSTARSGMQTFVSGPSRSGRHHFASNGRLKLIRMYEIVV